ncbi:MAG: glycoside hydrolase family 16 [Pseudonocardiales bacterium]|nr:glycoside hydrolase family 16 [Pseudonocardiales bacterium]
MRRQRWTWTVALAVAVTFLTGCASADSGPVAFRTSDSAEPSGTATVSGDVSSSSVVNAAPQLAPGAAATGAGYWTASPGATTDTKLAWSEDFDGAEGSVPQSTVLGYRLGGSGWGNNELQSYTALPTNASLDGNGNMAIRAIRETYTGTDNYTRQWTSARLDTLEKFSFTTGTISVRVKVPTGAGMWPAFWLLGSDLPTVGWPESGEIDVLEALGGKNQMYSSVHGPTDSKGPYDRTAAVNLPAGQSMGDEFHIFSVTRKTGRIDFFTDGNLTATFTPADLKAGERWVFDKPMFLTVNLAVGGWPGEPTAATPSPSVLLVDWIRFYT